MLFLKRSILFLSCCAYLHGQDASKQHYIQWGNHLGPTSALDIDTYDPSSVQLLYGLSADGTSSNALAPDNSTPDHTGDVIQLGFFDTDSDASTYTPNTDGTNPFHGTWTPLTQQTTIGHKLDSGDTFAGAGLFNFETRIHNQESGDPNTVVFDTSPTIYYDDVIDTNYQEAAAYRITEDYSSSDFYKKVDALAAATNPLIGIRFYDLATSSHAQGSNSDLTPDNGTSRYNTIMNPNWTFPAGAGILEMSLHQDVSGGALDTNLKFEFDNTNYGTGSGATSTARIGSNQTLSSQSASSLHSDDFVATVAYFDGAADLDISGANGDTILSGLTGTDTNTDIAGGSDGNQLTVHSNAGNTSGGYVFQGNINATGDTSTSTDITILKTGAGEQTFAGNIYTADSSDDSSESGYLNIAEGTVVLKPASGTSQKLEFITNLQNDGSTHTSGSLKLDNSDNSSQTVELGFANTAEKKTFSGAIELAGTNTENSVSIGGTTNRDAHQEFSGAITGTNKFKKAGVGKLTLTGNSNSYAGDGTDGVSIGDSSNNGGILVANHANALGTNDVTVDFGKLAVAGGITVTNTINGESSTSQKSVVGGGSGTSVGTITNSDAILNIGSGTGHIDVVSPGIATATSMSNGTNDNQVVAGNHDDSGADALAQSTGTLKIKSVGLKAGGVYDWEISNFDGSSGSDWDVLKFDSLAFDNSGNFDINILSLSSSAAAGAVSGSLSDKNGTSGFLFLDGSGSNGTGITWGAVGDPGQSGVVGANYFNINHDAFSYNNSNYYGDWSVYFDRPNNDFYLQYSVVPEPSTYIMVGGLLMLPGYSFIRRFRKKDEDDRGIS